MPVQSVMETNSCESIPGGDEPEIGGISRDVSLINFAQVDYGVSYGLICINGSYLSLTEGISFQVVSR